MSGPITRAQACAFMIGTILAMPAAAQQAAPAQPTPPAPNAAPATNATGGIEAVRAAVELAREDARRSFTSTTAAASAWARLERLRAPLLESDDPRAAAWLADAAEDALTVGLSIDSCGVATITGIPTAAQRERATVLLGDALARTRAAERSARAAISAGTATPELASRLDSVELAQRIPLLRACAAVLAGWAGALPAQDAPAIVESAAMRLATMRGGLTGNARALADLCCGLGMVRTGHRADGDAVLAPIAADPNAQPAMRVLAIAGLTENAAPSASGRRRALEALRARHAGTLDDQLRLLLGDLDFRLARAAAADATADRGAGAPPWRGWLDAVAMAAPARRADVRAEALARVARNAESMDDPVVRVARALAAVRGGESRAQGTAALRAALADPALDPGIRTVAMLELGRAELLMGRPAEGAVALLAFAEAHPSEPASRHAIDAAVAAARGTGDAALLARVLATATERFPDHPDNAAWKVERAALLLSPDAPAPSTDSAARRAAQALESLDRADRAGITDQALRADLAIAAAMALNEELQADAAIAALDRVKRSDAAKLPEALQQRMLEERIRALLLATRSITGDAVVAAAVAADANATADAAARVLRRMSAVDLGALAAASVDEQQVQRLGRLCDAVLAIAPPTPERDEVLARALVAARMHEQALAASRRAVAARGDRSDLLLALAESLWGIGGEPNLAEAFGLYERLARTVPEESPAWWLAQVRRLQILDRVGRSGDAVAPKVARLKAMDPALGGTAFAATLLDLAARHE